MHHANYPHQFDKEQPSHAFSIPREGELAGLFRQAFPEGHFDETHQEWRIDWDHKQFPDQGQRIEEFATAHDLEVLHRY